MSKWENLTYRVRDFASIAIPVSVIFVGVAFALFVAASSRGESGDVGAGWLAAGMALGMAIAGK